MHYADVRIREGVWRVNDVRRCGIRRKAGRDEGAVEEGSELLWRGKLGPDV